MTTDVKPDRMLVELGNSSDMKWANCGVSTHVDSVTEWHVIGATIFRSPEAMLSLMWGHATDV